MENRAIVCLGSNREAERNMALAVERLRARFADIRFSEAVWTTPVDCPAVLPFLNCVAVFGTDESSDDVRAFFKAVERELGRLPGDKAAGSVPMDIDLLQWNASVLKPADLRRPYVLAGLSSLAI